MKQLLFAPACGGSSDAATPIEVPQSTQAVRCGCSIPEIDHCGNFVEIDGKPYPIDSSACEGDTLGDMEWCGVDGATAEIAGEIKDGAFVASFIKKLQP